MIDRAGAVRRRAASILAWVFMCAASAAAVDRAAALSDPEATALGIDAYVYGYPLVTMDLARRVMTNVAAPDGARAPMGQFAHERQFPAAGFHDVTAPNANTLSSTAWLDLSAEPYVLSIPDVPGRYVAMPLLSAWTEVFQDIGTRTTGTKAQRYLIAGPRWNGTVPAGLTRYTAPTNLVWIVGRTACTGTPEDYQAVHALQDRYALVPLSAYGKAYKAPPGRVDTSIDMDTAIRDQVEGLDAAAFFGRLATLLADNPPAAADATTLAKLTQLGITPGQPFELAKAGPVVARTLPAVPLAATDRIKAHAKEAGASTNNWLVITRTGTYGTDYLQRATIAAIALGAGLPQDMVFASTGTDQRANRLNGARSRQYALHLEKSALPPVDGFWSLTMYNTKYAFVANPLSRYALGSRDPLQYNPDGSVDLILQAASPGEEWESNWLPSPADDFVVMLRLYAPKTAPPSILNGSWQPPPVRFIKGPPVNATPPAPPPLPPPDDAAAR